ncbi:MAG: aminoacyl-tRNA hydrolase [bacterium]
MRLIVGLGNPGLDYAQTRHNVGFKVINSLAKLNKIELKGRKYKSRMGQNNEVILAKPMTYVNLSGEAVELLVRHFQINLADLVVIYDDINLPVGKIRIRKEGSAGGHNGMKSIIEKLGSQQFPRIRVGIGSPPPEIEFRHYVLSNWTPQEKEIIEEATKRVVQAIICIIEEGIDIAMNKFN